jgi:hypothetical protein
MQRLNGSPIYFLFILLSSFLMLPLRVGAINLTLDRAVEIAMDSNYRIKQLKLGINRSRQMLTSISIGQFVKKQISLQNLLQTQNRQHETESNFLKTFLGYRKSLLTLMNGTFYDYENIIELLG